MVKTRIVCTAFFMTIIFLTGCGNTLPQMTKEQETQIVEYAAGIVMQYMKDYDSRLVDLSLYESNGESVPEQADKEEPEQGGMDAPADTDTIDVAETGSLADVLMPEGMEIAYTGYSVMNSYPEAESKDPYFAYDAAAGKQLLVLYFDISNTLGEAVELDIFSLAPKCTVTVNSVENQSVLPTMLLDDLNMYIGSIDAGETIQLVLLTEVEEELAGAIESLRLTVKTDAGRAVVLLQ